MISWEDVYKVVEAMAPLYVALILGFGSVKWWKIFTKDQCEAINRLVCYFTLPLFTFQFTAGVNPFKMNYLFFGADVISKLIFFISIAIWAKFWGTKNGTWSITSFSMCAFNNSLVVGVPLMEAMYGQLGVDLVVQSSVIQSILWVSILLFVLEFWQARIASVGSEGRGSDLEGRLDIDDARDRSSFWALLKIVIHKLVVNPNLYACVLGLVWALIAQRWDFKMPSIIEGCILILSRAGTGTAMFNMGIFMALQEKLIACGARLTVLGMVLRFLAAPAAMAVASVAVGLRGDVLSISIIQAALPQAIISFIFAKQYGLHAGVLSTAVIFGTLVSLPVLIAYYLILENLNKPWSL